MGTDYLIGGESYIAIRDVSTADYSTGLSAYPSSLSSYAYHRWDPGSDGLEYGQTPIRSEGAAGSRMGQDSRLGLVDRCGGDLTFPQMNFGNNFWAILFKHACGSIASSTVDSTGSLYYNHFYPATRSDSFIPNHYLELLHARRPWAGTAAKATRFIGGRVVSLRGEVEVGGHLKFTPSFVFQKTLATTRTAGSSILAIIASEAPPVSYEITLDCSGTLYDARSASFELNNGFFGDGQDDHILGSRFRVGVGFNEDGAVSGTIGLRQMEDVFATMAHSHTAFSLTLAATATVPFVTAATSYYPAAKFHFPKCYIESVDDKYKGHGRIPGEFNFYAEKDTSGTGDFAQAALQVEIWNGLAVGT